MRLLTTFIMLLSLAAFTGCAATSSGKAGCCGTCSSSHGHSHAEDKTCCGACGSEAKEEAACCGACGGKAE